MKLALGILALSTGSFFLWQGLRSEPAARAASSAVEAPTAASLEPGAGQELRPAAASAAAPRAAVALAPAGAPAAASATGTLLVRATWSDHTPAAGVNVSAEAWSTASPAFYAVQATTDESGEARLAPIAGRVHVYVDRVALPQNVQLDPGEEELVAFEIPLGIEVNGIVVDDDARGVAGAEVILSSRMNPTVPAFVVARADADGKFAIRSCPSGRYLGARASGFAPALMQMLLGDEGTTLRVELLLRGKGGVVEGNVFGPDGRALSDAVVLAGGPGDRWGRVLRYGASTGVLPDALAVRTDEQGRFRADGLELGTVSIAARAAGCAAWHGEVELVEGRTSTLDIWLTDGFSLTGQVIDSQGVPVAADVCVDEGLAFVHGPLASWVRTGPTGEFRFDDLGPGTIDVSAESDCGTESATARLQGAPGAELAWRAVLSPHASLLGRVVDENGAPLAGWYVHVNDAECPEEGDFDHAITETGENGRFEATNLHARPHDVEVVAEGCSAFPSVIAKHVSPGEGELTIVVESSKFPSIHIAGSILDEEGRPATGVQLTPWESTYSNAPIRTIDADGRFDLGPYPAGTWTLVLQAQGVPELRLGPKELVYGATWDLGEIVLGAEGFALR
jgi:protocatechuate 3,4-dioxygenase beta subunit